MRHRDLAGDGGRVLGLRGVDATVEFDSGMRSFFAISFLARDCSVGVDGPTLSGLRCRETPV